MNRLALSLLVLILPTAVVLADDSALTARVAQAQANEQRLRDTLRTTTQQLRAAEAQNATLLAGQAERDEKLAALETQVTALTKRSNEDKAQADASVATLRTSLAAQEQEVARLGATLSKWKAAYHQAAGVAKSAEHARTKLAAANLALERKVTDRERQNLELYKSAREILQRYADFSLGRALAAREPFTGLARVRIEEQVQDYADKLDDLKLKPAPSDGKPSTKPTSDRRPTSEPTHQPAQSASKPTPTTKTNP